MIHQDADYSCAQAYFVGSLDRWIADVFHNSRTHVRDLEGPRAWIFPEHKATANPNSRMSAHDLPLDVLEHDYALAVSGELYAKPSFDKVRTSQHFLHGSQES